MDTGKRVTHFFPDHKHPQLQLTLGGPLRWPIPPLDGKHGNRLGACAGGKGFPEYGCLRRSQALFHVREQGTQHKEGV